MSSLALAASISSNPQSLIHHGKTRNLDGITSTRLIINLHKRPLPSPNFNQPSLVLRKHRGTWSSGTFASLIASRTSPTGAGILIFANEAQSFEWRKGGGRLESFWTATLPLLTSSSRIHPDFFGFLVTYHRPTDPDKHSFFFERGTLVDKTYARWFTWWSMITFVDSWPFCGEIALGVHLMGFVRERRRKSIGTLLKTSGTTRSRVPLLVSIFLLRSFFLRFSLFRHSSRGEGSLSRFIPWVAWTTSILSLLFFRASSTAVERKKERKRENRECVSLGKW